MNSKEFERKQSIRKLQGQVGKLASALPPHPRGIGQVSAYWMLHLFSLARRTIERTSLADEPAHGFAAVVRTGRAGLVIDEMAAFVLAFGSVRGDEVPDTGTAV